eukprot:TRINITY_DN93_c0_g2_i1.p1 TRINITY_DN93_c0_g2~~TRINITY_DN93_c0_g2_i1.p1  ORF type:complete len:1186 (-),score=359.37 TRINITY_DN93_c0_g2_i1:72-3629(-)
MPFIKSTDGNCAAAHVAYGMSEACFLFPITPATTMGELADVWAESGRLNVFGKKVCVTQMQSEAGVAGAVHGAGAVGGLVSSFTCSQGLLLMIPDMFKIAGENIPAVFHVASRVIGSQAISIYVDHMDVMATRSTGFSMMCSHSVQEAADLALVSHVAALKAQLPFLHFFDGFRTSHEICKIELPTNEDMKAMVPWDCVQKHRSKALNPTHPVVKGTIQSSDIFFQMQEASQKAYNDVAEIVEEVMADFKKRFGREYHCFSYAGAPDAEYVIALMGSGSQTIEETIPYLAAHGYKVGCIKVHLFRPWSAKHFLAAIPKTCKRIAVLDRTKEFGSSGEPLLLDVLSSVAGVAGAPAIFGGRFGIGGKEFTPACVKAVYDNLSLASPKKNFTVNINDDVLHTSIPIGPNFSVIPKGTTQCVFWGLGADGTVGANHDAIRIIGDSTDMNVQGYFYYDAHKSGGLTISHLRFGKEPILSMYLILDADFVGCHFTNYVYKYRLLKNIKEGGIFVLNTAWKQEELDTMLPGSLKRDIVAKKVRFYTIDAAKIAEGVGLGRRINTVMQAIFFQLSGVLEFQRAVDLLKDAVKKTYSLKGQKIVDMNIKAISAAKDALIEVKVPAEWANATLETKTKIEGADKFYTELVTPSLELEGDELPVSHFQPGGVNPLGNTQFEKRGVAMQVPTWDSDKCTQCCECSSVCPHAAIRPFVITDEEAKARPEMVVVKGKGKTAPHNFRIQVSTMDCTGCEVCSHACKFGALKMQPFGDEARKEAKNWKYCRALPNRGSLWPRTTVMGSQFQQPMLEFSGCCEGCGETAYVKMLTQLFGERMVIANASGCSSVWGGTWGMVPYTTNEDGHGPAWANSLYEDNAEFGFGMAKATWARREYLATCAQKVLDNAALPVSAELRETLKQWREHYTQEQCDPIAKKISALVEKEKCGESTDEALRELYNNRDVFGRITYWAIGGDGWAYDIDYGGLDHVIAQGFKINILVLDTEMYSNTGGQKSKATNLGAIAKFAAGGCRRPKKDLGLMAMSYGDVYVASVSLQANPHHAVRAMVEAEAYPGTSVILAYAPCKEQGFPMSAVIEEAKAAIDSGYWPLYRYDPRKAPAMQMDSKVETTSKEQLEKFIMRENRFAALVRGAPAVAEQLHEQLVANKNTGLQRVKQMSVQTSFDKLKAGVEQGIPAKQ